MSTDEMGVSPDSTHKCDNCSSIWSGEQLDPICDIMQRINAGGTVPSGQCPECQALTYPFGPKEEFLERRGQWCPFCKSLVPPSKYKLKMGKLTGYVRRQHCPRCKKEWNDQYELTGFEEVKVGT